MWLGLLQHLEAHGLTLPHLRILVIGGAAAPRAMISKFELQHGVDVGAALSGPLSAGFEFSGNCMCLPPLLRAWRRLWGRGGLGQRGSARQRAVVPAADKPV